MKGFHVLSNFPFYCRMHPFREWKGEALAKNLANDYPFLILR